MSVKKTERTEGELIAITVTREAAEYIMKITDNEKVFPKRARKDIESRLAVLNHELNAKTEICPISQGIDYLGFHTYVTDSGKVIRKLRQKSKNKQRRKLKKLKGFIEKDKLTIEDVCASYQSWRAHAMNGNTYYLICKMDKYFDDLFKDYLAPGQGFMGKPKTKKQRRKACRN